MSEQDKKEKIMSDSPCAEHLSRIAVVETRFDSCNEKLDAIAGDIKLIVTAIHGNGSPGLKSETLVNTKSINRLWWAISLGVPSCLTVLGLFLNYV